MSDLSREAHEASFYDDDAFYDDPREVDDEEDERGRQLYRCTDMMCGALDCARCFPASFDALPEEEAR